MSMSKKKRGNEFAQLRREEYEEMESKGGKEEAVGSFKRASVAALAKRRIVSAKRPDRSSGGSSTPPSVPNPFAGFSFAPAPAPNTVATSKPGGNGFSFGGSTTTSDDAAPKSVGFAAGSTPASEKTSVGFNFGGLTPAAKPAETSNAGATPFVFNSSSATPSTPGFSFGSSTDKDEAAGTSKPFSFTPSSSFTPAPFTGGFVFGAPNNTTASNGGSISSLSSGNKTADRFQKHAIAIEKSFYEECSALPISRTFILPLLDDYLDMAYCLETEYWKRAASGQEKPKLAAVTFAPASTPANPGMFGIKPSAPEPASTPAAATLEGEPSDTPNDPAILAASDNVDHDWETIGQVDGVVSFYHSAPGSAFRLVAKGHPKFQVNKKTNCKRIIMRNEQTGKVLANMAIMPDNPFKFETAKSKKHVQGIEKVTLIGQILPELKRGNVCMSKPATGTTTLEDLITRTLAA